MKKLFIVAALGLIISSCSKGYDVAEQQPPQTPETPTEKVPNSFDFSTVQTVKLNVDYSAFNAKIPVFFSVYNVNPFVNENKIDEYIDENIKPIYAAYTKPDGKFDQTVTLPAFMSATSAS